MPAGRRRARGGRIALRLRARRRCGPRRLLHANRHPVFKSLQSRHSAGRARLGHRGYLDPSAFRRIAIPRGKPAAHRGDDETGRRRGFPGRPAMAVHRTGAARAGGRLGRRRIRGRDQRGTRRDLGQTGRGRRRARQGIGRAWRLASGDDVVGRRHRRPHAGGDAPPVFDRRWWQPLV